MSEITKRKWREEIRLEFGIGLREVMHHEWITSELEKESNRWLCKEYLEIPLTEFENLPATLPRIRHAAANLLAAWKDEHQIESSLLIDLPLEELGIRGAATDVRLSALPHRLGMGDRCWITGVPGAGKTVSLITIASALTGSDTLIPILVSLRDLSHGHRELLEWIASKPSFQEQGVSAPELANAASAGKLLILLNGWNEIARNEWIGTTRAITSFISEMPGSGVLVTSRQAPESGFPAVEFRIKALSGDDIRKAIRQSGLSDPDYHADVILASGPLSEIAAVSMFLQEIIQQAKEGHSLPLGKQAMLRCMVERAVKEHRAALEYGEVREHAFRYVRNLARKMTQLGRTALPDNDARLVISDTVRELKEEALFGRGSGPA